ncbi:MAG TPA: hypothetical protein VJN64_08730 [Terriglobales bacterium]|nr:hypothetical protein [Terriglobales bacterium]
MEANTGLLEIVASQPFESCEEEWRRLLKLFRMELVYVPAVQQVLQEGRWRGQPNPEAYVRKAAKRCARELGLVYTRPKQEILACELGEAEWDGERVTQDELLDLGTWKYESSKGKRDLSEFRSTADEVAEAVMDAPDTVDWEQVADFAILNDDERLVLELRLIGFGREQALASCFSEEDRKYLQAAWKRFERFREGIKEVLKTGKLLQDRRIHRTELPLELIFIQMEDMSLKISFRKSVPESPENGIHK